MSIRRMMLFTLGGFFKSIISLFKTRVLSNGGTFEAETNLENQLNTLGSTLFDSASLVITPNAYKEQTLYSIKPDKIGNNLLLWSEQFDNSYWNKTRCSIVPNQEIAPNGTLTADYVVEDNTTGLRYVGVLGVPTSTGQTYTFSIFVKKKDRSQIGIQINEGGSLFPTVKFNFDSQSFTQTSPLMTTSFQSVGNGWFRLILTRTPTTGTSTVFGIYPLNASGDFNQTGDGVSRTIIWGAQLELGSTATDYISTTDRAIVNGTIGDLTVTRATTATRVNEQGLIELVPYNILSYSEEISNNLWTKSDGSGTKVIVIENQGVSPRGDLTADLIVPTTDYKEHPIAPVISLSSLGINRVDTLNWSIYVKSAGNNFFILRTNMNNSWVSTIFNIQNGTIVSTHPNFASSNITNYGDGWYRISVVTQNITNYDSFQMISSPTSDITFSGDGVSGAYIWGAQLVQGTKLKPYQPTTNRLNIPRIDYTTGSPAILVEPQRTNLIVRSEEFENASWQKNNSSIIPNATISPSGLMNADKLVENNLLATHSIHIYLGGTELRTNSIFVKAGERSRFILWAGASGYMFDLINLTTTPGNNAASISNTSIQDYGNGWYRCSITTKDLANNGYSISLLDNNTSPLTPTPQYQGDGVSGLYIWGAQREDASSLTSYIPTTTSSVTRNADVISKSGINSLIGQTEGSVYLEVPLVDLKSNGRNFITLFFNSSNWVRFRIQTESLSNINIQTEWYVNAVFVNQGNANIPRSTSLNKILFTYKIGSQVNFFHNGVKLISTNPIITEIPPFDQINLGANQGQGSQIDEGIKIAALWKTQLTDQQAIQLTTL